MNNDQFLDTILLVRNFKPPPRPSLSHISRISGIDRTRLQPRKYDSREYGFDEDDQSSISPTTEDGSATRTVETGGTGAGAGARAGVGVGAATGEGEGSQDAGNAAVAGVATATATGALDEPNSLSSYADDFADDESIVPPAQHATTAPAVSSEKTSAVSTNGAAAAGGSGGGGNTATTQRGARDQAQQATSSESSVEENSNDGGNNIMNNQDDSDRDRKSRAEKGGVDQRRPSGSGKRDSGADVGGDGGGIINAGGTEADEADVGRDAAFAAGSSPSVSELKDRLREADLENARLREAMEKSAVASSGGSGDDRRELDILKGQVEAAK